MAKYFFYTMLFALFSSGSLMATPTISVDVMTIVAMKKETPSIDPQLRFMEKDLQALPLNHFLLLDRAEKKLIEGARFKTSFQGEKDTRHELFVTAKGITNKDKLRLEIAIPTLEFRTIAVVPNNGMMMIAGPQKGEKTLVFAIRAVSSKP